MRGQAPLALPPPAGVAHWGEDTPFGIKVMAAIGSANQAFLMLAAALNGSRPEQPVLGLSGRLVSDICRVAAGPAALALPFSLYDLRFRDERFWRQQISASRSVNDSTPTAGTDIRVSRFARTAVTLAWHFSQSEPRAARLSLGIEAPIQEMLGTLPIGALDTLASRVAGAVAARFCTRERFWSLVTAALRFGPDPSGTERLTLLGLQLLGADSARVQQIHRRQRRIAHA